MSKEIDLVKCIISEIDTNLYSDFGGNPCISYTSNLKKLLLALDTPEVRHFFENYEQQSERIAELEEQLKNVPKYNVYSKVFFIDDCEKTIKEDFVEQITINHRDGILYELINNFLFEESELFATKAEAEAKLQELQGE